MRLHLRWVRTSKKYNVDPQKITLINDIECRKLFQEVHKSPCPKFLSLFCSFELIVPYVLKSNTGIAKTKMR